MTSKSNKKLLSWASGTTIAREDNDIQTQQEASKLSFEDNNCKNDINKKLLSWVSGTTIAREGHEKSNSTRTGSLTIATSRSEFLYNPTVWKTLHLNSWQCPVDRQTFPTQAVHAESKLQNVKGCHWETVCVRMLCQNLDGRPHCCNPNNQPRCTRTNVYSPWT